MEKSTPPPTKVSFWHYINPVCLSAGIIGLALHFELEMLDLGMTGLEPFEVDRHLGTSKGRGYQITWYSWKPLKKCFGWSLCWH